MECWSHPGRCLWVLGRHGGSILSTFLSQMLRLGWAPYKGTLLEMLRVRRHSILSFVFLTALCRLCEALLSFLDFSDKKANTAIGLFTDLALEER